uniref:Capsid protein n=1 Tax=Grapevine leafroll-associated virus 1 TaxID=47985 RepID=A0A0C4JX31_9CLOS|nr:capsid protein [Grapevine leafroll-associated virus 1]
MASVISQNDDDYNVVRGGNIVVPRSPSLSGFGTSAYTIPAGEATAYVLKTQYSKPEAGTPEAGFPVVGVLPEENVFVKGPGGYTLRLSRPSTGQRPGDSEVVRREMGDKLKRTFNIAEIFTNPEMNVIFEPPKDMEVSVVVPTGPGLVTPAVATAISTELKNLCAEVMGNTDQKSLTDFFLAMLQLMLTFSTSPDTESKEEYFVNLYSNGERKLTYEKVKGDVVKGAEGSTFENPMRQNARLFSATAVHLILNEKLKPNQKVAMQHGVPKKFLPYTFDFRRPSYSQFSNDAIRAWQLAAESAFGRKSNVTSSVLRNTSELKV